MKEAKTKRKVMLIGMKRNMREKEVTRRISNCKRKKMLDKMRDGNRVQKG